MRLRCLAGAYAGEIRDYSTAVGFAALRSGTATRVDDDEPAAPVVSPVTASVTEPVAVSQMKRRRQK